MSASIDARLLAVWEAAAGRAALPRALVLAAAGGAAADVADLPIGRRDEYIWDLRRDCFGDKFSAVVDCPACGEELELDLTFDDVHAGPPKEEGGSVTAGGAGIDFRLITSRDLVSISGLPDARRHLIARCITSEANGGGRLGDHPDSTLDAISAAMLTLDPQAAVVVDVDCAVCAHEWSAPLDIAGYLWAELDAHAMRVLRDVHSLATAYGWSEADVLAVSPARRQLYLEMAEPSDFVDRILGRSEASGIRPLVPTMFEPAKRRTAAEPLTIGVFTDTGHDDAAQPKRRDVHEIAAPAPPMLSADPPTVAGAEDPPAALRAQSTPGEIHHHHHRGFPIVGQPARRAPHEAVASADSETSAAQDVDKATPDQSTVIAHAQPLTVGTHRRHARNPTCTSASGASKSKPLPTGRRLRAAARPRRGRNSHSTNTCAVERPIGDE